jgi:hypothetical protein
LSGERTVFVFMVVSPEQSKRRGICQIVLAKKGGCSFADEATSRNYYCI